MPATVFLAQNKLKNEKVGVEKLKNGFFNSPFFENQQQATENGIF